MFQLNQHVELGFQFFWKKIYFKATQPVFIKKKKDQNLDLVLNEVNILWDWRTYPPDK